MRIDKSADPVPTNMPATALALVLLGAAAICGIKVAQQVLMAPGTLLPPPATATLTPNTHNRQVAPSQKEKENDIVAGPTWASLTGIQKIALRPLEERWAMLSESQKRRWLALAPTFASLPTEEQTKLHERMTEWASLSARQRSQARLNYADAKRLPTSEKLAQWEAYQALSEEEKRMLAADAPAKPMGAAPALRPVAPQKLVQVPAATLAGPTRANPPKIPPVDLHAPRSIVVPMITAPVPAPLDAASAPPVSVETTPVSVPSASGATLPPLPPASSETPSPRPEDIGYQPQ